MGIFLLCGFKTEKCHLQNVKKFECPLKNAEYLKHNWNSTISTLNKL